MKILLSGGGTGGHIYPALALMNRLKELYPDAEFLYVGTERGMESTIVPKAGVPFKSVEIQGLRRSLSLENLKTIYLMIKSISKSKKIIKEFSPDVVIGTGGYVCAPVLYAASRLGIPSIIHEQNSVAGVTNKFLARYVSRICLCFEDARADFSKYPEKNVFTGNPRAQEVANIKQEASLTNYGLQNELPTALIFGGSRGAAKINQSMAEAIPLFKEKGYQVILVTGEQHFEKITSQVDSLGENLENVRIVPYVEEMPALFKKVNVVVCRSGATTLTELTALGIPSILIPSPYVTNNHQLKNAQSLEKKGAALILEEKELDAKVMFEAIDSLMMNQEKQKNMAEAARSLGIPDAADRLAAVVKEVIEE
ncbi:undecaprenyldiphospho-muramoylpentapeptide beta-N-acetylglucosaminyltransferase [Jeotgalibaca sp. MA1X17-3]|uniref:undecaprenyldiphospho-muramoylpentapeptide beta-N-acetylglucosaminyltransferase n=1 Tax=Jeotgalibaca sp. MA1X17-3 TaxID=2908211 RepID=UPI001F303F5D|nr:undecaprenyldiphospho-muramoylpentapeptide beta-N-acetylglucosaminyltransferase [Jeotgalibaca sp. MA1X17-3]UJF15125.1 undecaprenyldiphospho-muramoylpentapeptide beta-N-acetylglucosaminyltransferase [Jeotgalibaca sp. MA1X17-3]